MEKMSWEFSEFFLLFCAHSDRISMELIEQMCLKYARLMMIGKWWFFVCRRARVGLAICILSVGELRKMKCRLTHFKLANDVWVEPVVCQIDESAGVTWKRVWWKTSQMLTSFPSLKIRVACHVRQHHIFNIYTWMKWLEASSRCKTNLIVASQPDCAELSTSQKYQQNFPICTTQLALAVQ